MAALCGGARYGAGQGREGNIICAVQHIWLCAITGVLSHSAGLKRAVYGCKFYQFLMVILSSRVALYLFSIYTVYMPSQGMGRKTRVDCVER